MKDWLDWFMVQGDTAPSLPATLREADGSYARLTQAQSVEFVMRAESADEPKVQGQAQVQDASKGAIVYPWQAGDTDEPGFYLAHVRVTYADGSIATYPGGGYWEVQIRPRL